MREPDITNAGISIGGRQISNARYADDTALIAKNMNEMQEMVDRVNAAGIMRSLKLNAKKTKVMRVGSTREEDRTITIGDETVAEIDHFKYLGSIKNNVGSCTEDVRARIAMDKAKMTGLSKLWEDRALPTRLKMKLVKTLV